MRQRNAVALAVAVAVTLSASASASASELIDRNARNVKLAVNAKGEAMLTYTVRGRLRRVLAWGAVDAIAPTKARPQVKFKLDYSGGWGKYRRPVWTTFRNVCRPYRGPRLAWFVTACTAPDGSHWAVQQWQRALPNYGLAPTSVRAVWELRLSHWRGSPATLHIRLDWAYGQFHHLFGSFTYRAKGVYGFMATPIGVPLDTFGRNIYVDTLDSAYGRGWKRENGFLAQTGTGRFCYGFFPHGDRPIGAGTRYRATAIGPGVTPDVLWEAEAPGPYDSERDAEANEFQRTYFGEESPCRPN